MAREDCWTYDLFVATRALYEMVRTRPPGGVKNVLVVAVARAFGVKPRTVYARLFNFMSYDVRERLMGCDKGGKFVGWYFLMPKRQPGTYMTKLRRIRRQYKLQGII